MSPTQFLLVMLAIAVAALTGQRAIRWRRGGRLRDLARRENMHYSPRDRFRLSDRVAAHFPICGAADVRVFDLIYGIDEGDYRYVFTVDYTMGLIRTKQRLRRVGTFREPRGPAGEPAPISLRLAPEELPLIQQYERLLPEASSSVS